VSFTNTVATIRAAQQIGKGQEILHCYGELSPPVPLYCPSPPKKDRLDGNEQVTAQVSLPVQCLFPGRGNAVLGQKQRSSYHRREPFCGYAFVCLTAWSL
jgi:hypothetical protein